MTARLDAALVERGMVSSRQKAKELIAAGMVTVNGVTVQKASRPVDEGDAIGCVDTLHRYVGRGGEKLEKVLRETGLDVRGRCCVDIGASTGGFTDCLLQHGAGKVYALDVGHDQLHPRLRADGRVVSLEGTDVRRTADVLERMGADRPTVGTVDLSFISLRSVWPSIAALMGDDPAVAVLIKPQFEAGRAAVGKKGIVRDPADHRDVLGGLLSFWEESGWSVEYLSHSPVTGGEGNIEYLALIRPLNGGSPRRWTPRAVVEEAFAALR
ncbi:MAG: TlyA family RNA methyltransferase [Acutalibacteraceae bacterium]|jgi:23S rRNA (cytidine1920-2'-O)/16S rRNA (cytidine1409-2'-O)-methyltransferase